jgi:micrococcal nuclease
MKKLFLICLNVFVLNTAQAQTQARVIRVKDGDTYVVNVKGKPTTIRLNNVDAPEMNQAWGIKTAKQVTNMILGKNVMYTSTGTDKYGRILANVVVDGISLDEHLVKKGWAWVYTQYNTNTELPNLQTAAIGEGLGLWHCGINKVCPPWIFRSLNKLNRVKYCSGCKLIK